MPFSASAICASMSAIFCSAASASVSNALMRTAAFSFSASSSFKLSSAAAHCSLMRLSSPCPRITSSPPETISALTASISASILASEAAAALLFAKASSARAFVCSHSFCRVSISLILESTPVFFALDPPVMEPPALISCPSSVTILKAYLYCLAIAMASSKSSATTVLPSRLAIISRYCLSHCTRCVA